MAESEFNPVNEFEEVLMRASKQPETRPEFFQKLLTAQLWLLSPQPEIIPGAEVPEAGAGIQLATWIGTRGEYVPFFSSLEQLQAAISQAKEPYTCLVLEGADVFAMLAQKTLGAILNPGAACGKYFTPEDIRGLADETVSEVGIPVAPRTPSLLLSQPVEYPHHLIGAMREFFTKHPGVEAGYLVQAHNPARDDAPHLVIGIQCDKDVLQIATAAVAVAEGATDRVVDFVEAGKGNNVFDGYFQSSTTPFYKRMEP